MTYLFGPVTINRTMMYDLKDKPRYPLDEALGWKSTGKGKKYSDYVTYKSAEVATKITFEDAAYFLSDLTPVSISKQTVWNLTQEGGKAQKE